MKVARLSPGVRTILAVGFSCIGMLLLLSGVDTQRVVSDVLRKEQSLRWQHEQSNRRLDSIRDDLFISGTLIRDYLMDPHPTGANAHRAELERTRARMLATITEYSAEAPADETELISTLRQHVTSYWSSLEPAYQWSARERREHGFEWIQQQVYPRREALLSVANQIGSANALIYNSGSDDVRQLFTAFRKRFVASLAMLILLGSVMAIWTMVRILRLESDAALRHRETLRARDDLRALAASLVEVHEGERKVISRELSDSIAQSLAAVLFRVEHLVASLPAGLNTAVAADASAIRAVAEDTAAAVQHLSSHLYPSLLDQLGLTAAIEMEAGSFEERSGTSMMFLKRHVPPSLPDAVKTCLYRIFQETLALIRDRQQRPVRIALEAHDAELTLSIEYDRTDQETEREKLAVLAMRERVARLSGTLTHEWLAKGRVAMSVSIPLDSAQPRSITVGG